MNYAENTGDFRFREVVSEWQSKIINVEVNPNNVFLTNGNSQALDILISVFFREGDVMLLETPTYHFIQRIITDRHIQVFYVNKKLDL
jgi:2-aminoadipate transaminase